jgi:imidazolonepropionase
VKAELLVNPIGELVTCAPTDGPLRGLALGRLVKTKQAAIAVAGGKIIASGTSAEVLDRVTVDAKTKRIEAADKLVTPGLVDPHTHLVFAGNRANEFVLRSQGKSYEDIAAAGGGILATVQATRQASSQELLELAHLRLARLLAHGTTTCEIKTGYGLDLKTEMKLLEVICQLQVEQAVRIIPTFMAAHAVPPGESENHYVEKVIEEMLPAVVKLVRDHGYRTNQFDAAADNYERINNRCFIDVFCDRGYFSVSNSRRLLEAGKKAGLAPRIHADEFANLGATRLAVELGAAAADHLLKTSDEEIRLLAKSDTAAVILPGTSFYLHLKEHAPARTMIDQGVWTCLGSDFNPGSCNIFSLPMILGLACLHLQLTPEEALNCLTVNAAFMLGLGDQVGQIRDGYRADITIYDVSCLEEVAANIGWNPVIATIKDGRLVHGDNGITT